MCHQSTKFCETRSNSFCIILPTSKQTCSDQSASLSFLTAILQVNLGKLVFIEAKDVESWSMQSHAKLQSNHHHQQTDTKSYDENNFTANYTNATFHKTTVTEPEAISSSPHTKDRIHRFNSFSVATLSAGRQKVHPLQLSASPPSSLAPIKSRVETFWYRLTQVYLENSR